MRTLILSDIHSNWEALTAVIDDATERGGFDRIWCLGDIVGYGPDPGLCISLLRQHNAQAVAGNHDVVAVGKASSADFNYAAKAAIEWTANNLSAEDNRYLSGLPTVITAEPFTLVHGTLRDHVNEYLLERDSALATLERLETRYCAVGHTHLPFICREDGGAISFIEFAEEQAYPLGEERLIINPGCVGQPRDRNPRPSYAIYDDEANNVLRHRVEYRIQDTQEKMRDAQMPEYLIDRLNHGI